MTDVEVFWTRNLHRVNPGDPTVGVELVVPLADHERALAEARMDTVARMDQRVPANSKSVYEKGWNAALDAVQQAIRGTPSRSTDPGTFGDVVRRIAVTAAVERLRKAPVGE